MIFKILDLEVFANMFSYKLQDFILEQKFLNMLTKNGFISEEIKNVIVNELIQYKLNKP